MKYQYKSAHTDPKILAQIENSSDSTFTIYLTHVIKRKMSYLNNFFFWGIQVSTAWIYTNNTLN